MTKKKRTTRTRVAKRTARRRSTRAGGRLSLTLHEREVLKEACRRYRHDLPTYLETARSEAGLLEEILRKL